MAYFQGAQLPLFLDDAEISKILSLGVTSFVTDHVLAERMRISAMSLPSGGLWSVEEEAGC